MPRVSFCCVLLLGVCINKCHGYAPLSQRQKVGTSRAELPKVDTDGISRREAIVAAMAGLSAEAAWQTAVDVAANAATSPTDLGLSSDTIRTIESGRAAIIPNFMSLEECAELRRDVKQCYDGGYFKNFILSTNPKKADKQANDRWIMPSFYKSSKADGPFVDPSVGNFALRQRFKARMAQVKAY